MSANQSAWGRLYEKRVHAWLFLDIYVMDLCECVRQSVWLGTNLYSVPKVVVLGDAKSVCTDDILGGGPILHHMITVEEAKKE